MRVEGDELVVDIVEPASRLPQAKSEESRPAASDEGSSAPETKSKSVNSIPEKATSGQSERKGGPLARTAAIIGGEKGFWTFAKHKYGEEISSADQAEAWIKKVCSIESRVDLDHEPRSAQVFRPIEKAYRLWLEGYD
ncbi:hypothetical protein [Aminobacter carboxidus]|uniref:Uncharacterized protein n=1 Tax=Aminobacter carboxidus TaxID=376165 RepID=A0ABR9GWW1_9HYPH|nr:hypothetical protein [Aminobacter carboxidus]MBE1208171.1 hypothetical protein [Aminobacter carboxidus]